MGITAFLLSGTYGQAVLESNGCPDGELSDGIYGYLDEFMQRSIWEKWDDEIREFMLRTAFLQELTPAMCELLTGFPHCDNRLKELVKKGAFITHLRKGVYRYHHLFQQFLKRMVKKQGEEFVHSLISIEGDWHLSQMDFYGAMDCFIRCKNHQGIAKCIDFLADSGKKNIATIGGVLPIFKHPEFQNAAKSYPRLLFFLALGEFTEGRADDMVYYMDEYYARHHEIVANNPSSAYKKILMRICDFRVSLSQVVDEIGELAAVALSQPNFSVSLWSLSLHMPWIHRGIRDYSEFAVGNVVENLVDMQTKTGWLFGTETDIVIQTLTAEMLYEQGHLEKAQKHALEAMSLLNHNFLSDSHFGAMTIYVCIRDAIGEADDFPVPY